MSDENETGCGQNVGYLLARTGDDVTSNRNDIMSESDVCEGCYHHVFKEKGIERIGPLTLEEWIEEIERHGCKVTSVGAPLSGRGQPTGYRVLFPPEGEHDPPDGVEMTFDTARFKLACYKAAQTVQEEEQQ